MIESDLVLVYTTHKNEKEAEVLAEQLLREGLIACANIFPKGQSVFRWNGGIQIDSEVIAIMKTGKAKLADLESQYLALHPYETPCFLTLPSGFSAADYHQWAIEQLTSPE